MSVSEVVRKRVPGLEFKLESGINDASYKLNNLITASSMWDAVV